MQTSIKVIVVEDEMLVAEDIATDLTEIGCAVVGVFSSGEDCLEKVSLLDPDLIIMDIRIKGRYDGIETAKLINELRRCPIIYLSANTDRQTLNKVISIFPSLFISKPYNKTDLFLAVSLFTQLKLDKSISEVAKVEQAIFVKVGALHRKIVYSDILYIEGSGSYAKIVTKNETVITSHNLNYVQINIKDNQFKRVHRSYIVNMSNVDGFEQSYLLVGEYRVPVSRQYVKDTMQMFKRL
jgi:DNA-binding LytR/AlgR family response regulator